MKITEHNIETGEVTQRDATKEELAQVAKDEAELKVRLAEEVAKAAAKQALLAKLGITEDEAALLLGGN